MKKITTYFILAATLLLSACIKDYRDVDAPTFDVHTDSTTYPVNSPIIFHVSGTADRVTFYSGATGHNYDFKERTTITGTPQLQFSSQRLYGLNPTPVDTTLKVLVSNDFSNQVDLVNINKATWTDISSKGILSNNQSTAVPFGVVDLSAFYKPNTPIYLAFKYHDFQSSVSQRTWTITNIKVDSKLSDGSLVSIATVANLNWGVLNLLGTPTWSSNATQISISGGAINSPENLDWIISQPIFLDRVKQDMGVSIRSNVKALLTDYTFAGYANPGTYTAVFEAYNATRWDNKQVLKKITFTIK